MAHTYTPGLRVTADTIIRKERRLPIAGDVLLQEGAAVKATDVVAKAQLPGNVATVNVVNLLGIAAEEIDTFMLKKVGDVVAVGDEVAATQPFIKWFRSVAEAPVAGTVETVSKITGQVIIRTAPRPVELKGYIDGTVVAVRENEGLTIETSCAFIQGILGIGGEVHGQIAMIGSGRETVVTPADITDDLAGKVGVVGSRVSSDVYQRASEVGVTALICGGFNDVDLRKLLGRDLGVAITGHEDVSPILILTEGFGNIPMAEATYALLSAHAGQMASASGATQIRAGVMRPEIIIPKPAAASAKAVESLGLCKGARVRIIREPLFGTLGKVKSLPTALESLESEVKVRVAEITCDNGQTVTIPRANIEAIES